MGKEYDTETLRRLQLTEVEILDEIKRVCDKNSLKYYLIGGTLLGAVRHKGFIPWDDDLDIVMSRSDYEKFCSICQEELSEKYYLHNIDTDDKYWLPFAKVRKKNTIFDEQSVSHLDVPKGIYVDIFPLDFSVGDNDKGQAKRAKKIKKLSAAILFKAKVLKAKSLKSKIKYLLLAFFSVKSLSKKQINLMKKLKSGSHYVNYGSNYSTKKQTMPIGYYEPQKELIFEGKSYPVPNQYEKVLTRIYGETYMQLPPEEKRITHKPIRIEFEKEN